MKQIKKVLMSAFAFVMLMNSCIFNIPMQNVYASENVEAEPDKKDGTEDVNELIVTGISLAEETPVQLSPLAVPERFTVNVAMQAPEDVEITYISLSYVCDATGNSCSYDKWFQGDEALSPGIEGSVRKVDVEVNQYAAKGHYRASSIYIQTNKGDIGYTYQYGTENPMFVKWHTNEDGTETIVHEFTYGGEVDYDVAESEEDLSVPEITSVEMVTSGTIYSTTEVEYTIGYKEEGSGVKRINMSFQDRNKIISEENGNIVYDTRLLYFMASSEKEQVGEGTVSVHGQTGNIGTYQLNWISIEDYAGNIRYYTAADPDGNPDRLVCQEDEEKVLIVPDHTYTVSPAEGIVELKSVRIEAGTDKDNLTAGDEFDAVLTLRNITQNSVRVDPERSGINWMKDGGTGVMSAAGSGAPVTLAPGEEKDIIIHVKLRAHMLTGTWTVNFMNLITDSCSEMYGIHNGVLEGHDENGNLTGSLPYNQELDYTITVSENPDEEAPYIEEVSVATENVKVPGEITFALKVSREGYVKAKSVDFVFRNVENSNNHFSFSGKDYGAPLELTPSEEEGVYTCTGRLPDMAVKGSYSLDSAFIVDEEGNFRTYSKADGRLVDEEGNEFPACELEITESAVTDKDFEGPVLKDFILKDGNVRAGEKVQFVINAEEASGISNIQLVYRNNVNNHLLVLNGSDFVLQAEGNLYTFLVDKYCEEGNYKLLQVTLRDDSVRKNGSFYSYDERHYRLVPFGTDSGIYQPVAINGSLLLQVAQSQDMIIVDTDTGDISEAVKQVNDGGTVVIKSTEQEGTVLPQDFLTTVKEKKLTVVIPDLGTYSSANSELVISGESLGGTVPEKLELSVHRDEIVDNGKTIMVGNQTDNIYYPVTVAASDTAIPVTIRIRLDDDFRRKCGDSPVRLSKIRPDETTVLLQDNLKIDEDGYVEAVFENGLSGGAASQILYADGNGAQGTDSGNEILEFFVSSRTEGSGGFILGDINGDGSIKMADLMMCLHHVSGRTLLSGTQFAAADIDGDGKIAMTDLMKLLHYVSGRNKELS